MTPGERATFVGYRAASRLARGLPLPVAEVVGSGLGLALGRLMKGRRAMITKHLRRVHGSHLDGAALDREVRGAFASYARYWLESFRLPGSTPAELEAGMSYEGLEHLDAAIAAGKGVIVCMPHLGGWDYGGTWLASIGYPATVVVEALQPPELFEWFAAFRRSLGLTVVPLDDKAGTEILKVLRAGGVVGLISDRDLPRTGIEVDFFGERTTLPGGPATLALRTGATILPGATYFSGRRGHHSVVRPPLDTSRQGSIREDAQRVTQQLADELAALIRHAPDQWHLLQPNWPSDF